MKIVIFVDDSETVLMTVEQAVKPLEDKVQVLTFDNPLNVLEAIKEGFSYDLLITDINMPQMNGLDMAKELKNNPGLKLKPILALTTENAPHLKETAKKIGLAGWITKPFSDDKLVAGIKRVLKIR